MFSLVLKRFRFDSLMSIQLMQSSIAILGSMFFCWAQFQSRICPSLLAVTIFRPLSTIAIKVDLFLKKPNSLLKRCLHLYFYFKLLRYSYCLRPYMGMKIMLRDVLTFKQIDPPRKQPSLFAIKNVPSFKYQSNQYFHHQIKHSIYLLTNLKKFQ